MGNGHLALSFKVIYDHNFNEEHNDILKIWWNSINGVSLWNTHKMLKALP